MRGVQFKFRGNTLRYSTVAFVVSLTEVITRCVVCHVIGWVELLIEDGKTEDDLEDG